MWLGCGIAAHVLGTVYSRPVWLWSLMAAVSVTTEVVEA